MSEHESESSDRLQSARYRAGGLRDPRRRANAAGGPRQARIVVKVTAEERAALQARATRRGVTVQGLMVSSAMAEELELANVDQLRQAMSDLMAAQRVVGRLGDNMNQIAKVANQTQQVPSDFVPALRSVRGTWGEYESVLDQLERAVQRLGG